jgi:hypothetical protein
MDNDLQQGILAAKAGDKLGAFNFLTALENPPHCLRRTVSLERVDRRVWNWVLALASATHAPQCGAVLGSVYFGACLLACYTCTSTQVRV